MEAPFACVQQAWERPGHCLRHLHLTNKGETAWLPCLDVSMVKAYSVLCLRGYCWDLFSHAWHNLVSLSSSPRSEEASHAPWVTSQGSSMLHKEGALSDSFHRMQISGTGRMEEDLWSSALTPDCSVPEIWDPLLPGPSPIDQLDKQGYHTYHLEMSPGQGLPGTRQAQAALGETEARQIANSSRTRCKRQLP